ncbi:hypothetical protein ACG83_17095 [Frankia sp. R43]|uniref:hypothetical protein n=1 Tax=Frankia sp. R43 TaxID=269536 RepID=UPI0006CA594C|nr:hypothetical protein [Frankia sp. R43]KPM55051.1 hypothetical protein ACG83_17095 [Frankia sp. R43]
MEVAREEKIHLAVLAVRLAELHPDRYAVDGGDGPAPWASQQIGAHLRTAGVVVDDQVWAVGVKGKATNAVGVTRDAIRQAVTDRS